MPSTVIVGACGSVPDTSTGRYELAATASVSSTATSCSSIHHVIARNIAPVSRYRSPSRVATPRDVLDFPDPEGPSIATTTPTGTRLSLDPPTGAAYRWVVQPRCSSDVSR